MPFDSFGFCYTHQVLLFMAHTFSSVEYPAFQSSGRGPEIIGVSLSDPHTSVTGLRICVCILPCLLVATYKRFRFEWIYVKIHIHFRFSDVLFNVKFWLCMTMNSYYLTQCWWIYWVQGIAFGGCLTCWVSLLLSISKPSHCPVFDRLQYAKIEGKAGEHFLCDDVSVYPPQSKNELAWGFFLLVLSKC